MKKYDTAQYLVNLVTLIEFQKASGAHNPSKVLSTEFEKGWEVLKRQIMEVEDETRPNSDSPSGSQARTDLSQGDPSSSG